MAKGSPKRGDVDLTPHPLVTSLAKHLARGRGVRILHGYVGEPQGKGHTRVYLDHELRSYVDVPTAAIAHRARLEQVGPVDEADVLWVSADAPIQHRGAWIASEDPTTMATGEEGDPDPTTMATGEESSGFSNPMDQFVNPFGTF